VEKERTYETGAYLLFWVTCGGGLSTFAIGSSYVTFGLTTGQTCGAVLIGASLTSLSALLMGKMGAVNYLGFVHIFTLDRLDMKLAFINYVRACLLWMSRMVSPFNPRLFEQYALFRLAGILRRFVN
jgi:hypothetical protein